MEEKQREERNEMKSETSAMAFRRIKEKREKRFAMEIRRKEGDEMIAKIGDCFSFLHFVRKRNFW